MSLTPKLFFKFHQTVKNLDNPFLASMFGRKIIGVHTASRFIKDFFLLMAAVVLDSMCFIKAGCGSFLPCSQLRQVSSGMKNRFAASCWVNLKKFRHRLSSLANFMVHLKIKKRLNSIASVARMAIVQTATAAFQPVAQAVPAKIAAMITASKSHAAIFPHLSGFISPTLGDSPTFVNT